MNDSQHLRESMWDLVYGLLTEEENQALIARIKSDPAAARLYAEVRLQADLIGQAATVEDSSIVLNATLATRETPTTIPFRGAAAAPAMAKQKRRIPAAAWLVSAGATALMTLLAVGLAWPRASETQLARNLVALDVLADPVIPAGLTRRVALRTYFVSTDGTPADGTSANVQVRLLDPSGHEVLRKAVNTDLAGHALVEIPGEMLEPGVRLEAATSGTAFDDHSVTRQNVEGVVAADLPVQPEPQMAYFLVSEPTVEAGKPVDVSLWNFAAFSNRPSPVETTQAAIDTVAGLKVKEAPANGQQQGLVNATLEAESNAPVGGLAAQLGQNLQREAASPTASAKNEPASRELGRSANPSAPTATQPADSLAAVRMRQAQPKQNVEQRSGRQYSQSYRANNAVPPQNLAAGPAGGNLAGETQSATVAAGQPIKVPIPAELVGKPLVATAVCRGTTVATAVIDGWTSTSSFGNRAEKAQQAKDELEFELPPEVDGAIEVSLFDRSTGEPSLASQRIFYREPTRQLQIALAGGKDRFAPGEQVQLELRVTDEGGKPVADTRLGVRVWNEQAVEQAAEQPVLLADAIRGSYAETAQDFSVQQQFARSSIDSYQWQSAGGRGQRGATEELNKIAAAKDKKVAGNEQQNPTEAERLIESGERSGLAPSDDVQGSFASSLAKIQPVELASNRDSVRAAIQSSATSARYDRKQALATIGRFAVVGGVALLLLVGAATVLRRMANWPVLVPAVCAALASLLIGLSWSGWLAVDERGAVAMATRSAPAAAATDEAPLVELSDRADRILTSESASGAPGSTLAYKEGQDGARRDLDEAKSITPLSASVDVDSQALVQGQQPRAGGLADEADANKRLAEKSETAAAVPPIAGGGIGGPGFGGASPAARSPARAAAIPSPDAARQLQPAPEAAPVILGVNAVPSLQAAGRGGEVASAEQRATKPDTASAPPSIYFNPQLVTDAEGKANIQFQMPAVESEYRLLIDALGHGRVGSRQDQLIIQRPPAAK